MCFVGRWKGPHRSPFKRLLCRGKLCSNYCAGIIGQCLILSSTKKTSGRKKLWLHMFYYLSCYTISNEWNNLLITFRMSHLTRGVTVNISWYCAYSIHHNIFIQIERFPVQSKIILKLRKTWGGHKHPNWTFCSGIIFALNLFAKLYTRQVSVSF